MLIQCVIFCFKGFGDKIVSVNAEIQSWVFYGFNFFTLDKHSFVNEFAGRALLRLKDHHLGFLGLEAEEQQQEILQDLLLLRVQEEIRELSDICSGENVNDFLFRL